MNAPARYSRVDAERAFMDGLRDRYVGEGFTFVTDPAPDQLPEFLGSYTPDAIASKPGTNLAIAVKPRPGAGTGRSLRDIQRLFAGHPDWQLVVTYMGVDPLANLTIPASPRASILARLQEVRALVPVQRHAAFVMAWSLLEAALHSVEDDAPARPSTPGTVVQTLAMLGLIAPETEGKLRPLIEVRNRIVHGDLGTEPSADDVSLVIGAVEEAMAIEV